ncbi:hypothetical protein BJ138DRAFT_991184, partial [Hygrophoropsis aurantiaca]
LAYVEWFTRPRNKDSNHNMYPVQKSFRDGERDSSIIEIDTIFRNCHLIPKFGGRANRGWTSENV